MLSGFELAQRVIVYCSFKWFTANPSFSEKWKSWDPVLKMLPAAWKLVFWKNSFFVILLRPKMVKLNISCWFKIIFKKWSGIATSTLSLLGVFKDVELENALCRMSKLSMSILLQSGILLGWVDKPMHLAKWMVAPGQVTLMHLVKCTKFLFFWTALVQVAYDGTQPSDTPDCFIQWACIYLHLTKLGMF